MKKCDIELAYWNDGLFGVYPIKVEKKYVFYVIMNKGGSTVGMVSKKYVTDIKVIEEDADAPTELNRFDGLGMDYFVGRKVRVNLNEKYILTLNILAKEKYIWSGIIGENREFINSKVISMDDEELVLTGTDRFFEKNIPMEEVVRIEAKDYA